MNRGYCDSLIEDALAGLPVKVYTNCDEKYRHLPEGFKLWVIGDRRHNKVTLDILFEGVEEYTIFFGGWHGHFGPDVTDELVYVMKKIFSNMAYTEGIVLEGETLSAGLMFEPDGEKRWIYADYAPCDEANARGYAGEELIRKGAKVVCTFFDKDSDRVFDFKGEQP